MQLPHGNYQCKQAVDSLQVLTVYKFSRQHIQSKHIQSRGRTMTPPPPTSSLLLAGPESSHKKKASQEAHATKLLRSAATVDAYTPTTDYRGLAFACHPSRCNVRMLYYFAIGCASVLVGRNGLDMTTLGGGGDGALLLFHQLQIPVSHLCLTFDSGGLLRALFEQDELAARCSSAGGLRP